MVACDFPAFKSRYDLAVKLLIATSCILPFSAGAQDSRTVVDNDQVKVLSVLVQPHQKTRMHDHKVNRVMIYLRPGKQDLNYQDGHKRVLNWGAGEAKWSPASGMHVAEITSDQPVRIIEIELKKPGSKSGMPANPLDPVKIDPKHYKVDFENDQVRVVRVKIPAGEMAPMHKHVLNRVVVYLTDQKNRVTTADGKQEVVVHKAEDASWGAPAQHKEENIGTTPFEVYAVELKN
jgi:quercetin dioxygenase-like cupin family protein